MTNAKTPRAATPPFLADFRPFRDMYSGAQPLFPSQQAARWAVRVLRVRLAEAEAVAIHRRELMFHPARVAHVVEREALDRFRSRALGNTPRD